MTPKDETELSEMIRGANGPLRIVGGDTRRVGAVDGETLTTSALTGITTYDPGALTLVVRAGTPVAMIEETLAGEGQRLAFEPMDPRALQGTTGTPTIGGVVAGNVSGPRRIAVGACRDFMLGVRFVDGSGEIVKNGGRVMKNVTGYDLVKLMTGSHGTLGVLTEVSLKVLPKPEAGATLVLHDLGVADAVRAMSAALGSPFEVTGAAHRPDRGETLLRLEGFDGSVRYRTGQLKDKLAAFGEISLRDDAGTDWTDIRDAAPLAAAEGDVWRISVRPTDAPGVIAALPQGAPHLLDWGGGLIWAAVPAGHDLRGTLGEIRGHATRVRASDSLWPTFQPELGPLATLSAGLRAKFDPRGLLNPGLMD